MSVLHNCLQRGMTFSESVQVEAPANVVWDTVCDLEALPAIVTAVVGLERVAGTLPQEGSRFRETRLHKNQEFTMYKTVTRLEHDNPEQRSLSLGIAVPTRLLQPVFPVRELPFRQLMLARICALR